MYQVVELGDKKVPMRASAATPVFYKNIFQEDVLRCFNDPDAPTEWIARLAYIMAKQGEGADMKLLNEDDFVAWLDTFDALDIFGVSENNKVIELFGKQQKTTVEEKKRPAPPKEK